MAVNVHVVWSCRFKNVLCNSTAPPFIKKEGCLRVGSHYAANQLQHAIVSCISAEILEINISALLQSTEFLQRFTTSLNQC